MPKADIGDAKIYYEISGNGPPLFLIPGLGGGGAFWRNQIAAFENEFTVIIHDHRGCGQSTHSLITYSVDQMASDVCKLMDALDVDSAHLCGHSTGGAICQTIAQEDPRRIKSMVLSATWPGQDAFFNRSFEARRLVLEKLGVENYAKTSLLTLLPAWWIAENDDKVDDMGAGLSAYNPPVEVMLSRIDAIMAFDRRAGLGAIDVPTLVIVAGDDTVTPVHMSDELGASIPGAQKVVLARGGHFAPIVEPEPYNAAVLDFLRAQREV